MMSSHHTAPARPRAGLPSYVAHRTVRPYVDAEGAYAA
ncbi:hypothetical protein SFR_3392 [Streptomyces sp. FR-008]|nr:hypothetical protein SFR_3392 [Streptomyces sp. FR-008]